MKMSSRPARQSDGHRRPAPKLADASASRPRGPQESPLGSQQEGIHMKRVRDGMGGKAQIGATVLTEAAAPRGYLAPTLKNGIQLRRALQPSTELPGCRSLRRGILAGYSEAAKA